MSGLSVELILQLLNLVAVPIIAYIISELKKLDNRLFDLQRSVLTRTEYLDEIREIREHLHQISTPKH